MDTKIAGCLFGTALGDALGAETEFLDIERIRHQFPPNGPLEPPIPARITDDTQMAIAVGDALVQAPRPYAPDSLAGHLKQAYIDWYNHPENNRAPGRTCLNGCEQLINGVDWRESGSISSKGCGANMRVMPVGLLDVDETDRAGIAQLQSALTHAHSTGLAAADLTAFTIAELKAGTDPLTIPAHAREYITSQREVYHEAWLGDLWKRANMMRDAAEFMAYGWDECLGILDRLDEALVIGDRDSDPCLATGEGWIAEEAYGTALLCFLLFPDDPIAALQRAAFSSGDSDSIAAITGAFAGVYHGVDVWPENWITRLEPDYRERIEALVEAFPA